MDTIIISKPINATVFNLIDDHCLAQVELMPEVQEFLNERDELIAVIERKSPEAAKELGRLSDLCVALGATFGSEMLRLGIEIGRNPQVVFDVPDEC